MILTRIHNGQDKHKVDPYSDQDNCLPSQDPQQTWQTLTFTESTTDRTNTKSIRIAIRTIAYLHRTHNRQDKHGPSQNPHRTEKRVKKNKNLSRSTHDYSWQDKCLPSQNPQRTERKRPQSIDIAVRTKLPTFAEPTTERAVHMGPGLVDTEAVTVRLAPAVCVDIVVTVVGGCGVRHHRRVHAEDRGLNGSAGGHCQESWGVGS